MIIIGVIFMFMVICVQQRIIIAQRKVLEEINSRALEMLKGEPPKRQVHQGSILAHPVKLSRA